MQSPISVVTRMLLIRGGRKSGTCSTCSICKNVTKFL